MLFPLLGFLVVAGVAGFLAWDGHVMNVATIEGTLRRHHATEIRVTLDWVETEWNRRIYSYDVAYVDATGRRRGNRCRVSEDEVYWRYGLEGGAGG